MNSTSWNGEEWVATLTLPAWRAFTRGMPEEQVEVVFLNSGEDQPDQPPDVRRLSVLSYLTERQAEICGLVVNAMRGYYDEMRPKYLDFLEEPDAMMPANPTAATFSSLHQLLTLYVHDVYRDGQPYVGYQFRAEWDIEHGVGVLMNGMRIVEVEGADTAFIGWNAERDRDRAG